jgi:hypothetical protein
VINEDLAPTPSSRTISDVKEFVPSLVNVSMGDGSPNENLEFEKLRVVNTMRSESLDPINEEE